MTEATQPEAPKMQTHAHIFEALAAAQAEFSPVTKNKINPGFNSQYADLGEILAAVRPALNRHGIFLFQRVEMVQGGVTVETVLAHASGETLESGKLFMPAETRNGKVNAAQALGSARTYACRYSLSSFLGVAADDDDDGNAAGKPGNFTNPPPPRQRQQPQPRQAQAQQQEPVLTQEKVDEGHLAAEGGMAGYQAFWQSQTPKIRKLLSTSGWHDALKAEAQKVDAEASKGGQAA